MRLRAEPCSLRERAEEPTTTPARDLDSRAKSPLVKAPEEEISLDLDEL